MFVVLPAFLVFAIFRWQEFAEKLAPEPVGLAELIASSGKLTFRAPERTDLIAVRALHEDPDILRENGWDTDSVASIVQMLNDSARYFYWAQSTVAAFDASTNALVGLSTVAYSEQVPGTTLSLMIATEFRGRGHGSELLALAITLVRQSTYDPVWVGTSSKNESMKRTIERLGYTVDRGPVPYDSPPGQVTEAIWYQVGADAPPPAFTPPPDFTP